MDLNETENYLVIADPALGEIIKLNGHLPISPRRGSYEALARSIISQQISVKSAASIFERFEQATQLLPENALDLTAEQVKSIGLSSQKAHYLADLAAHFVNNPQVFDHLEDLSDEEVVAELTKVKGVGVWTAQMFLMFTLQRPDVFAPGDRGLQLAIERIYNLSATPTETSMLKIAELWRPYRTTASLHLWQSLDNKP